MLAMFILLLRMILVSCRFVSEFHTHRHIANIYSLLPVHPYLHTYILYMHVYNAFVRTYMYIKFHTCMYRCIRAELYLHSH